MPIAWPHIRPSTSPPSPTTSSLIGPTPATAIASRPRMACRMSTPKSRRFGATATSIVGTAFSASRQRRPSLRQYRHRHLAHRGRARRQTWHHPRVHPVHPVHPAPPFLLRSHHIRPRCRRHRPRRRCLPRHPTSLLRSSSAHKVAPRSARCFSQPLARNPRRYSMALSPRSTFGMLVRSMRSSLALTRRR